MDMDTRQIPIIFLCHIVVCFYVVRTIQSIFVRAIVTLVPCLILTYLGCSHLPYFEIGSIMIICLYWFFMIRMIHMIVLVPDEQTSFFRYLWKFAWVLMPIVPCQTTQPIVYDLAVGFSKFFITLWINRWLLICEPSDSYIRIVMFFVSVCAATFINEIQIVAVRIITRNKYTILDFNNYPFLSQTLREFWGRRYNRLVNTLLKESIFYPVHRSLKLTTTLAALSSFIVSGLLHAHVAIAAFGASSAIPAFLFFFLHGLGCSVEALWPFSVPKPLKILLTQIFIIITGPLYLGLFTRVGPKFVELNKPMLFDTIIIPSFLVPSFCPK